MKVVILAGGLGTRLAEETGSRPKPMVEIGGRPILWHIMKHYASHGLREFVIALGYKSAVVKRYFLDSCAMNGDLTVKLATGEVERCNVRGEDWTVHLVETGVDANTGGRVLALKPMLENEAFMLTYGDGVSNVDLGRLLEFHQSQGLAATLTAVRPPARFGGLVIDDDSRVARFTEKPQIGEGWVNGGFMVFEPDVLDYLKGPETSLESDALERIAADGRLAAYRHDRFWQCMDTKRDLRLLESLWQSGDPPWKTWHP